MQSFYQIEVNKDAFTIEFLFEEYVQAKALDGKYVIITNIEKERMSKEEVRKQYKNLQHVEHAFRDIKTGFIRGKTYFSHKRRYYKRTCTGCYVCLCNNNGN